MKNFLYFFAFVFVFSACKKGNTDTPTPTPQPTNKELLTAKAWKYVSWKVNPPIKDTAGLDVSDVLAYKKPCERDDIILFISNGNVNFDEGPTKCDANAPQVQVNYWYFSSTEKEINIGNNKFRVDLLTADTMKWSFDDWQGSTPVVHSIVFAH